MTKHNSFKQIEHLVSVEPKDNFTTQVLNKNKVPLALHIVRLGFNTLGHFFPKKASDLAVKLFGKPRFRARHKRSDELIESAKKSDLLIDGKTIKIYEWGQGEQTILLAHGWESRGTALRSFIPNLVAAGFKVLAYDGPAHGESGGHWASLVTFGITVQNIIQSKGNIYGIIAHSFGGPSSAFALRNSNIEMPKLAFIACPDAIAIAVSDAIKTMKLPKKVAHNFIKAIESILEQSIDSTTIPKLADQLNIKEVLVVHDIEDKIIPINAAIANARAFEQSRFMTTQGLGHNRILKHEAVVNAVTDFIIH